MSTGASRGQIHHGDNYLVIQSMVSNSFSGVFKIADIIERVKVSDGGHAVFFEHFGMKIDDISGALAQGNDVDSASKGLQSNIRSDFAPETVHHVKGRFTAVKEKGLKPGPASRFDIGNTGIHGSFDRREKIIC
jgi:hypothetical protein